MSRKKKNLRDGASRAAVLKKEASYPKTRMGKPVAGYFNQKPEPGSLRLSSLLKKLKTMGDGGEHSYESIKKLHREVGDNCEVHGPLEDPIVGLVGEQVAFVCPWCSAPAMLAAWEAEGESD
jgi:hypothetical protein